jgi:ankyrin repeat protein
MKYIKLFEEHIKYSIYEIIAMHSDDIEKLVIEELNKSKSEIDIELLSDIINYSQIDVNFRVDGNKITFLQKCIQYDLEDIIKLLLEHPNIQLNKKDNWGRTEIIIAAEWNRNEVIKMLSENPEIDVNVQDVRQCTALLFPIFNANSDGFYFLAENPNISYDFVDDSGDNFLMIAIMRFNEPDVLKILMKNIDINAQNKNGGTALMIADAFKNYNAIEMLLKNSDLDKSITNERGLTAWDMMSSGVRQRYPDANPDYYSLLKRM